MISELYRDYGTVCHSICVFLNRRNDSTLLQIHKNIFKSDISLIYQGLSILIQRNIVTYYKLNSKYYYRFSDNRRVYFNLYLTYIKKMYDLTNYKQFFLILLLGSYKLNDTNIKIYNDDFIVPVSSFNNNKRTKSSIYAVNFDKLDKVLIDLYTVKLLHVRYSKSMAEIYKSVCKCSVITIQNVLNNLDSNSILIKDNISYINEVSNIEEYLKYLINYKAIIRDIESDKYMKGNTKLLLRNNEFCNIFKSEIRLINLFTDLKHIQDSNISKYCLMKDYKDKMYKLLKYKIVHTEGGDTWTFNDKWTYKILQIFNIDIEKRLKVINQLYSEGSVIENEKFLVYVCEYNHLTFLTFLLE